MKDQTSKLIEGIQTEQMARELMDERKSKELKLSENNIQIEMNVEKQNRRESEAKITKMIDERLYSLKLDLAKEKKISEEAEDRYYKTYGEQINRLSEEIEMENRLREENSQTLVNKLSQEIGKFHEMLQLERKVMLLQMYMCS